jgi:YD repeat-containing protein
MPKNLLSKITNIATAMFSSANNYLFSNDSKRKLSKKRKLSFEILESRDFLSVAPFQIAATGIFNLDRNLADTTRQNTLYAYYVDNISGQIDGCNPGDSDYLDKAISRLIGGEMLPTNTDSNPLSGKLSLTLSEEYVGKYLTFFVESTPSSRPQTDYYFIFDSANENNSTHFRGNLKSGTENGTLDLEDTSPDLNPDNDFNDLKLTTQFIPKDYSSNGTESNNPDSIYSNCCSSLECQCGCNAQLLAFLQDGILIEANGQIYASSNNQFRIIQNTFSLPTNGELPERIIATLQFANLDPITVYYSTDGLYNSDLVSFGIGVDVSSLASGRYDWTVEIESSFANNATSTITRNGTQDVVNWSDNNETGKAWNITAVDKVEITSNGVNWLKGNGDSIWFTLENDGTYKVENGNEIGTQLTNTNGIITITKKNGTKYIFNAAGFIVTIIDPTGNLTSHTYDSQDRPTTTPPPNGHTITYQYNAAGLLESRTDFTGRSEIYAYDEFDRLVSVTLPDPDGNGQKVAPVTTYSYIGETSLIDQITDAENNTTTFSYNNSGIITSITRGNRIETIQPYGSAVVTDLSESGYDYEHPALLQPESAKLGQKIDANNNIIWFETDIFGNTTYEKMSNGYEVNYIRNENGNVVKMIESIPRGNGTYETRITEFLYDNSGNLTTLKNPDGNIESWTYDTTFNQVTSYTDQLGRETLYDIDATTGLVLSVTNVVGKLTMSSMARRMMLLQVTRTQPHRQQQTLRRQV